MNLDPQILHFEQHVEVGLLIQRDADILVERWSRRAIQEQPNAARAHHQAILDDLPHLLRTLGQSLAESIGVNGSPHQTPARQHGQQRWEVGWSLPEVVRDYQILRLVVFEYLEETLDRPLHFREIMAIGLVLDEAITASVSSFARQSDTSLREQTDALKEADQRKNEFLAVLGHELRNPLAPILTSIEMLRLIGSTDANTLRARDIIERQVKQMVRLIDDLLDLTRIAQGKLELRRSRFDLGKAMGQAVQTVRPLFESQGHHLSVQLPSEPIELEADEARVVQVLVNLLSNAGKYTDRGGQVRLTASRDGDSVVLRVRDNGIGIEPDMLGRIFDLFTQVGRSLHRSQGGLGIGLTLVRQIVELHGGSVSVHSDGSGRGSEFTVRLPVAMAGAASADSARSLSQLGVPQLAAPSCHILIVEDNSDARETLTLLLQMLGHHIEAVATGPEGVARALAVRPQVVLIDLGLPELDGFQVAQQIRAVLGEAVLLVALTGYAQEEDRQRTQDAGFDAHLSKPVELEELNRVLAGGRSVS
jgi:signal transduction histidine kinase/CheY-like chemotaxis protein